ncbi:serine/threonine protein kinase [Streptomyces viridochromogenes]|uniref:non-specific serine/threonine protein kinase n=1 Tax=Streptomyces viridochromogenes TaxID=1938 RepID=A0A0J8BP44_STRVR|nr:serine/threonine-protein kinase [Streptomyces viridochromogenes]KMS67360.1 serine/threonine protein kinase [Streptomyces viridochromogenes]
MSEDGGPTGPNGRVIGGRYRLIERIGSGGMGTVWRALDELVDREVAVKQPRLPGDPEDAAHQRAAHRLYREARAAARVEHPSAVAIHDVVVEDTLPWIVMELVRGESLHELLRRGPVEATEAARIGLAVLGALRAAHAVGIVHRDVKPANVLLGPHRRVVLTDFGIAHIQGEESLTVSGEFVGSLEFIAPERMSGRGAGPASDLWSLGVLLYAAVEGWSPFRRTTLESTLAAILAADPPEPKQAGPLGPLIVRLLVKDPERRPDAAEVGAVLEAVAEGWPVPVPSGGSAGAGPQDASGLREFAEDSGTVRLRGRTASAETGEPEPEPKSGASSEAAPEPISEAVEGTSDAEVTGPPTTSGSRRRSWTLRPVPVAVLGVLLVGGTWFTTSSFLVDTDDGKAMNPVYTAPLAPASSPSPTALTWTRHREEKLSAVLSVPSRYELFHRQGSPTDQPRLVIYEGDRISVRLTRWDKVSEPLKSQAGLHSSYWKLTDDKASTQYNDTSFKGYDAVLADTTYEDGDVPTRVMELFVMTDDARLYALRVKMPKGTAREKEGTAVYKGARDRLEIE